jgi:hypothetical protein
MECASYFDFCRLAETSREKARLYIAALLFNVACWSDARKPDHRPTLTSSVVASSSIGAMSGYGYGSTLASSVVAWSLGL